MSITPEQVRQAVLFLIAFVLSTAVHEFGHAWVATKLGDSLPRAQGRLTLSPLAHIDPVGTLLMPLLMQLSSAPLLGWGKPVFTNPLNFTRRFSIPTGRMLVAIAGPLMNLALAAAVSLLVILGSRVGVMSGEIAIGLVDHLVRLNLFLMFFNLLPIPPLDGGSILAWVLPRAWGRAIDFLGRWGFMILFLVVMSPLMRFLMYPGAVLAQVWKDGVLRGAGL